MLKKIMAIVCTLFMLVSMSAFAMETVISAPSVRNGDFESGLDSADWSPAANGTLSSDLKHNGQSSLRIPSQTTQVIMKQTITFDFVAGEKYMFSYWYRNPKEGGYSYGAKGKVQLYESGNYASTLYDETIGNYAANGAWVNKTKVFTPANNMTGIEIWLINNSNDGSGLPIYFDDITLTERPPIADAGFTGWEAVMAGGSTYELISSGLKPGEDCMKITGGTSDNPDIYYAWMYLKPNTEYEFSFYFKSDSANGYPRAQIGDLHYEDNSANWCFSEFDNAATNKPLVTADTWVKCTYYFKTGETVPLNSYGYTSLSLYGLRGITCYYGDVEIKEAKNKIMLHEMAGTYGEDMKNLASLSNHSTVYAKGRFTPTATLTNSVLIAAVYDESTGTKQLKDVKVAPYTGTNGVAQTLETAITVENPETSSVEVYMWDSLSGMSRYLKKLRVSAEQ